FLLESAVLVPRAHAALRDGDLDAFAAATTLSQQLAETHLRNQVPQTVELVRSAAQLGARTASAFGAGFGGSVWALVPTADADGFAAEWRGRDLPAGGAAETARTLGTPPGAADRRPAPRCRAPRRHCQDLRVEDRSSTPHQSPTRKNCSRVSGAAQAFRSAPPTARNAGSTTSSRSACRCVAGAKPASRPVS